jgi:ABC-type sulfate/molybdate transport systems ATPase subunit
MIGVERISKRYGATQALAPTSFEVAAGDALVLLGPSGSGKTTLLRLIAGLELPDEGRILLDGKPASDAARALPAHKRGIGFVFQNVALWPHLTAAQNITFALGSVKREDREARLAGVVEQMGLKGLERRYPGQLSGGEAKRVALARALAGNPRRLLLDEPLAHLDQAARSAMLSLLQGIIACRSTTVLYVTHDDAEARQVCARHLHISGE